MDGMGLLLFVLLALVILTIFGINAYSFFMTSSPVQEGFEEMPDSTKKSSPDSSFAPISEQIRAVLEPMNITELCPLYAQIRDTAKKNELAGPNPPTEQEALKRVEADLATRIPGGALPCPLFQWPSTTATDLEWLDWLQKIPKDFGARVIFMAVYARDFLQKQEDDLKGALRGEVNTEGFQDICTPDVAATRRAEAAKRQEAEACVLPEELSPNQIQESVSKLLKELVATKLKLLSAKGMDPTLDIRPLIKEASKSAAYLKQQGAAAESGTLTMSAPVPGL